MSRVSLDIDRCEFLIARAEQRVTELRDITVRCDDAGEWTEDDKRRARNLARYSSRDIRAARRMLDNA